MFDVLCIGESFAATFCAWQCQQQGLKVLHLGHPGVLGSSHFSGALQLGVSPALPLQDSFKEHLAAICKSHPQHPYHILGSSNVLKNLVQGLKNWQQLGQTLNASYGAPSTDLSRQLETVTAKLYCNEAGIPLPAFAALQSHETTFPEKEDAIVVWRKPSLKPQQVWPSQLFSEASIVALGANSYPDNYWSFLHRLQQPGEIEQWAQSTSSFVQNFKRIFIPPLLGWDGDVEQRRQRLQAIWKKDVYELLAHDSPLPAQRLQWFWQQAQTNRPKSSLPAIQNISTDKNKVNYVQLSNGQKIQANHYIIADHPNNRYGSDIQEYLQDKKYDHAVYFKKQWQDNHLWQQRGFKVNEQLQVIASTDKIFQNLYAIGPSLLGQTADVFAQEGVAIASAQSLANHLANNGH